MRKYNLFSGVLLQKKEIIYPVFDELVRDKICYYTLKGKERKHPCYKEYKNSGLYESHAKLDFILSYVKHSPDQRYHGCMFNMTQSKVSEWIHFLLPVLASSLIKLKAAPIMGDVFSYDSKDLLDFLSIDVTEIYIPRKTDYKAQEEDYSGKKKAHTCKYLAGTDQKKEILFISLGYEGRVHDKTIWDDLSIESNTPILMDLGFQGADKENEQIELPHKKPKGKQLNQKQKKENRELSKKRVGIEHAFGHVKKLKILGEKTRLKKTDIRDLLMFIGVGIYNLGFRMAEKNTGLVM